MNPLFLPNDDIAQCMAQLNKVRRSLYEQEDSLTEHQLKRVNEAEFGADRSRILLDYEALSRILKELKSKRKIWTIY